MTTTAGSDAPRTAADTLAAWLASPAKVRTWRPHPGWYPQSLAYGAAGVALLHVERAHRSQGSWERAHEWLACAAGEAVYGGDDTHLFEGAPAVAFALTAAAAGRPGRYSRALDALDRRIGAATRRRLDRAHARIDRAAWPSLAEFDAVRGLTGLGAYLLSRHAHSDLCRAVLTYLVRLTAPLPDAAGVSADGLTRPGWWSAEDPSGQRSASFPRGHANNGMAHGIAGPLALLALALREGVQVAGQLNAILTILDWFDLCRRPRPGGPRWPYWSDDLVNPAGSGLTDRFAGHQRAARPSWCYGTAGIARAQQLAALALGDRGRERSAGLALAAGLRDPAQLVAITDPGLCHGHAGLAHIAVRAALDASEADVADALTSCLPHLTATVLASPAVTLDPATTPCPDVGLLDGTAGIALALHTLDSRTPPLSGWDTCLLVG